MSHLSHIVSFIRQWTMSLKFSGIYGVVSHVCLIFSPPCVFLYKAIDVAHTQTTLNQLFYRTIGLRTTFSYFVGGNLGLLTGEWGWHTLEDKLIPLPVAHWHDVLTLNLSVDSAEMQGMWQEGVDNHRCGVKILVCTGDEHILGCRTIIYPIFPTSYNYREKGKEMVRNIDVFIFEIIYFLGLYVATPKQPWIIRNNSNQSAEYLRSLNFNTSRFIFVGSEFSA